MKFSRKALMFFFFFNKVGNCEQSLDNPRHRITYDRLIQIDEFNINKRSNK